MQEKIAQHQSRSVIADYLGRPFDQTYINYFCRELPAKIEMNIVGKQAAHIQGLIKKYYFPKGDYFFIKPKNLLSLNDGEINHFLVPRDEKVEISLNLEAHLPEQDRNNEFCSGSEILISSYLKRYTHIPGMEIIESTRQACYMLGYFYGNVPEKIMSWAFNGYAVSFKNYCWQSYPLKVIYKPTVIRKKQHRWSYLQSDFYVVQEQKVKASGHIETRISPKASADMVLCNDVKNNCSKPIADLHLYVKDNENPFKEALIEEFSAGNIRAEMDCQYNSGDQLDFLIELNSTKIEGQVGVKWSNPLANGNFLTCFIFPDPPSVEALSTIVQHIRSEREKLCL